MKPTFAEILGSPQFTFLLGEAKDPVVVHAQVLAALSRPLDRLINGPMREAQDKCAELPDIAKDDFLRLCEFAYRGDYTIPEPAADPAVDEDGSHAQDDGMHREACQAWEEKVDQQRREHRRLEEQEETVLGVPKIALNVRFNNRKYLPGRHPRESLSNDWYPAIEAPDDYDFTPLLLAHAKLYTLADRYMIQSLKDLSLHKLHRDLQCLSASFPNSRRAADAVALARFAYTNDNTPDRGHEGVVDEMRQLVAEFFAIEAEWVGDDRSFEELLEGTGEFAVDFWRILRKEQSRQKMEAALWAI